MMNDIEDVKGAILAALTENNYALHIEATSDVDEYTRYDGTHFYMFREDSVKYGTSAGAIHITVNGYTFSYDLDCGEWEGDEELIEDEDIVEALEDLEDFVDYEDFDDDMKWSIYAQENGIDEDCDYYRYDDEDRPHDVDELADIEVTVPVKVALALSHGACSEWMDMDVQMSGEDLYHIYRMLKEQDALPYVHEDLFDDDDEYDDEEIEIPDEDIEDMNPDLYDNLLSQVIAAAELDDESMEANLQFMLLVNNQLFEDSL